MNELQIGLLAIGAIVVVAVLAYNKWQERRYRREAERGMQSGHDDVLMAGEVPDSNRTDAQAVGAGMATAGDAARIEPLPASPGPAPGETPDSPMLHETLDFIVAMEAGADIEGAALIKASAELLGGFGKPVGIE